MGRDGRGYRVHAAGLERHFATVSLAPYLSGSRSYLAHQAGVADNVRSEDRRQFALLTGQRHLPG